MARGQLYELVTSPLKVFIGLEVDKGFCHYIWRGRYYFVFDFFSGLLSGKLVVMTVVGNCCQFYMFKN